MVTIAGEGKISGIGLHSGELCEIGLKPGASGSGIQFFKNKRPVKMTPASIQSDGRCTAIGRGDETIRTIEHLLAVFFSLQITDVEVHVKGSELPALDGSALPFLKWVKEIGLLPASSPKTFEIKEPIFCYEPKKAIAIYPGKDLQVSYVLDYDHPQLNDQKVDFKISPDTFEKEIAPARTFCTEKEAGVLREQGFGKGANDQNTLIISTVGPVNNAFRLKQECARHKVLDLLGDLALLGFPVAGRVIGLRSGHSLNRALVIEIMKQRGGHE
jgi:UDP-3-O-acyl N-acetylglucosamine deacetylase